MLARDTRIFAWDAGTVGGVTACTGGYAACSNATAPDGKTAFHGVFIGGGRRCFFVQGLLRQIERQIADVFVSKRGGHGRHQRWSAIRAVTQGRMVATGFEVMQLL